MQFSKEMKKLSIFYKEFTTFFQCFFQNILEFNSKLVKEHFHQFSDDFMNFSQNPPTFTIDQQKIAFFVKTAKNAIFGS